MNEQKTSNVDPNPNDPATRTNGPARPDDGTAEREESALDAELADARAEAERYLEQAQRSQAELANYRRRMNAEIEQIRRNAGENLIARLLPVLDDFHRAIAAVPQADRDDPWVQGILLIERKLWSILEAQGVRPIEALGQRFNPSIHEAVAVEDGADGANTVVEEFQRGYMLNDRVLRPSVVKVGHGNVETPDEQE